MKCDIIIPVWNLKDYTQQCVESIIKNTDYPYRLIIIDNGSGKETKEYLESLKNDKRLPGYVLIRNEKNEGYTIATNQGMEISDAPYVCLHNNDTIVCKGWLREMVAVAESSKEIGIVNPNSNNLGTKKPWHMSLDRYAEKLLKESKCRYIEMATAIGFCYLIKREVIDKIGILKVGYGLGNFEDTEYSIRAFRNGYKSVFARGPYVWHAQNASFDLVEEYETIFKKNQEIFCEMFGKIGRILYIITRNNDSYFRKMKEDTYRLAQRCNWITVISKRKLGKLLLNEHTNIIKRRYRSVFFRLRCVYLVLVKKKKYLRILTDDPVIFWILRMLKRVHKAKLVKIQDLLYLDDSSFVLLNLGCKKRACYGYVNIDEHVRKKRVFRYSFSDMPLDNRCGRKILLDCKAVSGKSQEEQKAIFQELERVAVPGCILSIDNYEESIAEVIKSHNFIPLSENQVKLMSVKSFIYRVPYVKDDISGVLQALRAVSGQKTFVFLKEKIFDKGVYVNFFDKSSLGQICDENNLIIDSIEAKDSAIELKVTSRVISSANITPARRKKICAIGQFMLLRYNQLGFDWDSWPRAFEKLGMEYFLIEGMRNVDEKSIEDAIIFFKPDYLLVILKDNMPLIKAMKPKLKSMGTKIIYWFCDPEHPQKEDLSDVIDTMFLSNRGQIEEYKKTYNLERVFYMPQGYDPYIQHRLNLPEIYDVGFSGAISGEPLHRSRKELINAMSVRYGVKIKNNVRNNIAEFYSQSKTVFGVSDFDYELYTSNRFFVALGCGACYVAKKFKGMELLAENKKHLVWFETKDELFDILDYYLRHDSEREKIRAAASRLALEKHTDESRIRNVMDIMEDKTKDFYGFL